jgi:serine-type D-Ala-D-Ala carboxypeptidase (penicillin-binding protein 5/6)
MRLSLGLAILAVSGLVLSASVPAAAAARGAAPAPSPGGILAKGADLVNAGTGTVLWDRGLATERPMGSITKVMTALVVLRDGNLGQKITIPAGAVTYVNKYGASSAGLRPGDTITAQQLLEALLLPSGCDAAYVLAAAYGPGQTAFVAQMNATARRLGLAHTHFANFDGLPWPTETSSYSTPADLITLGRDAMALAPFRAIAGQRTYHLAAGSGHHAYTWATTDLLLGSYPGADGIKTGFTAVAGYCLLFEAKKGSTVLIGVVLDSTATNANDRFKDATTMLNWGFSHSAAFRPPRLWGARQLPGD